MQVRNTFDDMVNQLNNKKESIIADLDSKEKSLISEVNKNPRLWNSKSLKINLKTDEPDFSSAVSLDVTLTQVCFRIDVSLSLSVDGQQSFKTISRQLHCQSMSALFLAILEASGLKQIFLDCTVLLKLSMMDQFIR